MQEIMKDGSEGKRYEADTIEDLIPQIKKSLETPDVKYVKVFKATTPVTNEESFTVEEEKKDLIEQIIEDDKKEKKKRPFPYLKRS